MKAPWVEIQTSEYSVKTEPKLIASINRKRTLLLCVLARYQIIQRMHREGKEHVGHCPFNGPWSPDHGQFRVTLSGGRWRCEGCHQEGGAVEFVARLESVPNELAAVLICTWFSRRWPSRVIR
jgi:hypothetical protein